MTDGQDLTEGQDITDGHEDERVSSADLRQASFPKARRGYDQQAVHDFLDRVADWVETNAGGGAQASSKLTSEFAKVGERTAGVLTAAEDAAAKMRGEAKEYAEGLRGEAKEFAEGLRRDAKEFAEELRASTEEETRKEKLNASQKADELIAEAESKAERIIEETVVRRRRLNQAVSSLIARRDEIAVDAKRLADDLLEAVEAMRSGEPIDPDEEDDFEDEPIEDTPIDDEAEASDAEAERSRLIRAGFSPGATGHEEPAELEPPDQRETTINETG